MKISTCHKTKMIKRTATQSYICAFCGYASGTIDTAGRKYRKTKLNATLFKYELVVPKKIPKTFDHYPSNTI